MAQWARYINLGIGLYLLIISSSATSMMCFVLGLVLLLTSSRLASLNYARPVFMTGVLAIVCLLGFEQKFGISGRISEALGRGPHLSGRTEIWQKILEKNTSHMIGSGFRGFWETPEGESVSQELGTNRLVTAHNGYLETYLNGGLIALMLLGFFIWSTGINAVTKLVQGDSIGRVAILFWPILLIYNMTESTFFQIGSLWYTLLLVTINSPWQKTFIEVIPETDCLSADVDPFEQTWGMQKHE